MINRDLSEYIEWENSRNSALTNLKRNLNAFHLILLTVLIMFTFYVIKNSGVNKNMIFGGLIVIIAVIIWRMSSEKVKEPIPENVIKIICTRLMRRKIAVEYPSGTHIVPLPYCSLRYEGVFGAKFTPWKWEVGMRIITPEGLKIDLLVCLHPYDGYITRIIKMPEGYDGSISQDMKVMVPNEFSMPSETTTQGATEAPRK